MTRDKVTPDAGSVDDGRHSRHFVTAVTGRGLVASLPSRDAGEGPPATVRRLLYGYCPPKK